MALTTNGAALRAIREAKGWGLRKLASQAGVSHSHLSNMEAGRKQGSPEVLRGLADLLDVPLAAITGSHDLQDVA
jgi:transcriptional regulator with XRE-family HTH domain